MSADLVTALLDNWEVGAGAAGGLGISALVLKTIVNHYIKKHEELEAKLMDHASQHASREELNKAIGSLRLEFTDRTNEVKKEISTTKAEIKTDLNQISSNIHHQLNQALEIIKIFKGKD